MSEICARELRATLLGNQPDWKPTHETTYQHTRRRCDGRRMGRRARASFARRRRAKRDRQVSRADGPSDAQNNAEAAAPVTGHDTRYGALHPLRGTTPDQKRCTAYRSGAHSITRTNAESARRRPTQRGGRGTRYGARHPLRSATPITGHDTRYGARHPLRGTTPDQKRCTAYGSGAAHPITRTNAESARRRPKHQRGGRCTRYGAAAPVTGRDTRSEGVHCLRIGCSAPNHKNKRGIREMTTDTHQAPGARSV